MITKNRKARTTVMITGIMVATVGCSSNTSSLTPEVLTSVETSTLVTNDDILKPESLTLWINVGLQEEDGLAQWEKEFEEKTGIPIDVTYIPVDEYNQKLELAFASEEVPDVFAVASERASVYASQGALADLTDLVANSEVMSKINPGILDSVRIDDKLYGIPIERGNGQVTYMRGDWLEEKGLDIPTTYEEFIEVLRAFKTIDETIIPFTAPGFYEGGAEMYLREFYQDASPEFVYKEGQWIDGMMEDNMRDALIRMRDAYAEELIDLEVLTNKTFTCRDKWYTGQVGAFTYWAGNWARSLEDRLQANHPDAYVVAIPPIEETKYLERVPTQIGIFSKSDNIEGIFKYFIEYMHDGEEGSILFQHGVEGLHWERQGDEIIHLPKLSTPEEILEKALVTPALALREITAPNSNYILDQRIESTIRLHQENSIPLQIMPISTTLWKINDQLIELREMTIANIVMGNIDVDEGLMLYEIEARSLGVDQVLEELNK